MTSKRSWNSLRLLRSELGRGMWMTALYAVALFFTLPVVAVLILQQCRERLEYGNTDLAGVGADLTEIFCQNPFVTAVVLVGALVCGLAVFSYLHSRARTDLYHALPIRRQGIFFAQYTVGVLAFLLPFLVMWGAALGIVALSGFGTLVDYGGVFAAMGCHLLGYLLCYSTAVLAANLCGNLVVSALGAGVLCGILPALTALVYYFASRSLDTLYTSSEMLGQLLVRMSPVSFYLLLVTGEGVTTLDLVGAVGALALMVLAALFLHRDRASEAAGHAIAFRWLVPVVKYPILLAVTCVCGMVFNSLGEGLGWMIFGFLCGALLCHAVLEMIFHSDIRAWKKGLPGLGVYAVCFALGAVVLGFDLMGYDAWVPRQEEVESVQVDLNGIPGGNLGGTESWSSIFPGGQQYEPGYPGISSVRYDDPEIVDAVLGMAAEGAELAAMDQERRSLSLAQESTPVGSLAVIFHLENGRTVVRSYPWITQKTWEQAAETLFENRQYRENTYPLLSLESFEGLVAFPDVFYSGRVPLQNWAIRDREDLEKLAQVYRREYARLGWQDLSRQQEVATLTLASDVGYTVEELYFRAWGDGELREYSVMPVYESFTETLALLRELVGFEVITEYTSETVERIEVSYDRYLGENLGWEQETRVIDDPAEIDTELRRMVICQGDVWVTADLGVTDGNRVWVEAAAGKSLYIYGAENGSYSITLQLTDGGYLTDVYYRENQAPQWLKDALERGE